MKARTFSRKHFRRYRLWFGNIWIAGRAVIWTEAFIGLWHFIGYLWRTRGRKPYPGWRRRMMACSRCQYFNRERMTCGTAGKFWENPVTREWEQAGCLCSIALKSKDPEARCWLVGVTDGAVDRWRNL